jgi:hypothetical protein
MMRWRSEPRSIGELLGAIVVEPLLTGLEALNYRVAAVLDVMARVLRGRGVAAADVTALRAPPQMQPPATLGKALDTTRRAGRNQSLDRAVVRHSLIFSRTRGGHTALVHTAAASNLGQMLNKLCIVDDVPLVNVVRPDAQEEILRAIGATHVVNSTSPGFRENLIDAIGAAGATLAFDAVGHVVRLRQINNRARVVAVQAAIMMTQAYVSFRMLLELVCARREAVLVLGTR